MAHYFCIAVGMADCTPNSQDYRIASDETEFREIVCAACEQWHKDQDHTEFRAYEFRMPKEGENNYSQRLLISMAEDWVLDVIGMTSDDWARESEEDKF